MTLTTVYICFLFRSNETKWRKLINLFSFSFAGNWQKIGEEKQRREKINLRDTIISDDVKFNFYTMFRLVCQKSKISWPINQSKMVEHENLSLRKVCKDSSHFPVRIFWVILGFHLGWSAGKTQLKSNYDSKKRTIVWSPFIPLDWISCETLCFRILIFFLFAIFAFGRCTFT